MTATLAPRPVLCRRARRVLGGVSAGLADHIGVRVILVRAAFVILTFSGGLGIVLYGVFWIVLPVQPGAAPRRWLPSWLEYVIAVGAAVAALFGIAQAVPVGRLFVPAVLGSLGGALIWRQASDAQREAWLRLSRSSLGARPVERAGLLRMLAGALLVMLGALAVLARADLSAARDGFVAVAVAVVGIALITGPWWVKMVGDLSAERRERIRAQERADLAAQLHDSVLQTLALIQRNANAPREVTRLARGQERELRTLLYGESSAAGQLTAALRQAAAEVEDAYAIAVDVVFVGEAVIDDRLRSLVAAAREALVNAAKHARVAAVALYAEVEAENYRVFIRDRGVGFDLNMIGQDRHGIRGSIMGRIERHSGEVAIRTEPGGGTEVELRMPR